MRGVLSVVDVCTKKRSADTRVDSLRSGWIRERMDGCGRWVKAVIICTDLVSGWEVHRADRGRTPARAFRGGDLKTGGAPTLGLVRFKVGFSKGRRARSWCYHHVVDDSQQLAPAYWPPWDLPILRAHTQH